MADSVTVAEHRLHALKALRAEMRERGYTTRLQPYGDHPYLMVLYNPVGGEFVFTFRHHTDGPSYVWQQARRTHPLTDPRGAARAITADIATMRQPIGATR